MATRALGVGRYGDQRKSTASTPGRTQHQGSGAHAKASKQDSVDWTRESYRSVFLTCTCSNPTTVAFAWVSPAAWPWVTRDSHGMTMPMRQPRAPQSCSMRRALPAHPIAHCAMARSLIRPNCPKSGPPRVRLPDHIADHSLVYT